MYIIFSNALNNSQYMFIKIIALFPSPIFIIILKNFKTSFNKISKILWPILHFFIILINIFFHKMHDRLKNRSNLAYF